MKNYSAYEKLSSNLEAKLKSKEMEVATLKLKHQNKIETANVTYFNLYLRQI